MPRLLELFSRTGSVGRAIKLYVWEVVSLDSDPSCGATICADFLAFDYKVLGGAFDVVWASPCCTQYSIAHSKAKTPRDLEGADAVVARALEIIEHFRPRVWFLENPASVFFEEPLVCRLAPVLRRRILRLWRTAPKKDPNLV